MCEIIGNKKKVLKAINFIFPNQQNDFLIQYKERKTQLPKNYKNNLYTKIYCQVSLYAIQKIQKQVKKSRNALDKNLQLFFSIKFF